LQVFFWLKEAVVLYGDMAMHLTWRFDHDSLSTSVFFPKKKVINTFLPFSSFCFPLFLCKNSQSFRFLLPFTQGDSKSMEPIKKKICRNLNCKNLFFPKPHNATRQEYCRKPECRRASKVDSQKRWAEKPENRNYFCGPTNVERVQEWRKNHPGYWRRKSENPINALQEILNQQPPENMDTADLPSGVLQDIESTQHLVLLGLIAEFTGVALQDDLEITVHRLLQLGQDIVNNSIHSRGG
jgi:hypothetical protein